MFICIPSAEIVAFGGIGYSFKMLNSMFSTASTNFKWEHDLYKNQLQIRWYQFGWLIRWEDERIGAPLKGHTHTQISFGLAAQANEWKKDPSHWLVWGTQQYKAEDILSEIC